MKLRNNTIGLSIIVALVLQIMPMPSIVEQYRPDWVFLVLGYWALALPERVNVGVAFIVGLVLDLLLGTSIGVHSFAMSLSVFVLAANYQRLRNYSVWQQAIVIGILCALYNLVVFWLMHLLTDIYFMLTYMWPVITSMVIWPWIFWLLRRVRRQFRLS
ncbi:rod shape-determining protein MreD [Paraglaciecola chathamensis]|jgi:rod shape-determining protein MreD|uniref:Rod shape-determining protein MreD n=2 Tax=Paraglaciecola chathamensis TaxID=368405 RepID=A0A8H9M1Q3_9ALTE|nr:MULTISPECIES: rod shape-determining protein MreD [Paraglaciecola]AEE25046.1 rod shape-determining protein MreD [Glaciecola sp. 4H-3-7+YE-5]MBN27495.1 rod shape-determining protein MreD [Alteromonadaceae bacterium]MBJ2136772.1 rod shape-determining protein MreD [Paraglaciecola chathamensis]MBU3017817.1 rod shape-determining protein MreD [Paraglaciecola agarilytica]MDO6558835.1 rod shape-determining protein MreD [Paraglaciecola chathamensis]|tara:strand:+ start:791 stop:1267 length:477 start_codon:yes stop_codon:yes gene_type:complete